MNEHTQQINPPDYQKLVADLNDYLKLWVLGDAKVVKEIIMTHISIFRDCPPLLVFVSLKCMHDRSTDAEQKSKIICSQIEKLFHSFRTSYNHLTIAKTSSEKMRYFIELVNVITDLCLEDTAYEDRWFAPIENVIAALVEKPLKHIFEEKHVARSEIVGIFNSKFQSWVEPENENLKDELALDLALGLFKNLPTSS